MLVRWWDGGEKDGCSEVMVMVRVMMRKASTNIAIIIIFIIDNLNFKKLLINKIIFLNIKKILLLLLLVNNNNNNIISIISSRNPLLDGEASSCGDQTPLHFQLLVVVKRKFEDYFKII